MRGPRQAPRTARRSPRVQRAGLTTARPRTTWRCPGGCSEKWRTGAGHGITPPLRPWPRP
eukprot:5237716-Lingulodinium_polyedra.AAC.1